MTEKFRFRSAQSSAGYAIQIAVCIGVCSLMYAIYVATYLPFMPTADHTVGTDYQLHFPNLLTGYYWYLQNGLWATPWFSPSQCGGVPFFPDPNVVYLTLTQMLVIAVSPMRAVQITFLLFSLIGMLGTFLLVRQSFNSSRTAATVAAALFLFNGFFAARMLIGHLTFHAFALLPLMIAAALPPVSAARRSACEIGIRITIAGSCLAYMFQAGMVQVIPSMLITTAALMLMHAIIHGWRIAPWVIMTGAGVLALALCASRLYAELALMANFPRDMYPLPGIPGLGKTLWTLFQSLFLDLSSRNLEILNAPVSIERHEWENGVSIAPLLIFALLGASMVLRRRGFKFSKLTVGRVLAFSMLIILLATPIALNVYEPSWNAFLKGLPYIRNSSSMVRFFSAYILVLAVSSGLAFDAIRLLVGTQHPGSLAMAAAMLAVMIWQTLASDRKYYEMRSYDIGPIETEYQRVRASRDIPAVETISGRAKHRASAPNDGMLNGQSQMYCYQPIFGYRQENFPREPLESGPVFSPVGTGAINLKYPACYVFPKENSCEPGDHFAVTAIDDAVAFATYRSFDFERPWQQDAAGWVSIATCAAVLTFLFGAFVRMSLRHLAAVWRQAIVGRKYRSQS